MNEIKIFENPEFVQIKDFQSKTKKPYLGYVYVLEFGNKVKIGCTESPVSLLSIKIECNYVALNLDRQKRYQSLLTQITDERSMNE